MKGRNPSLATKAGLGAGFTLLGLGWRLGRRSVTDNEQLVRTVWAHPRGRDLAHRFCCGGEGFRPERGSQVR